MTDDRNTSPPGGGDLPDDTWVSLSEAAELTGYDPDTLRRLAPKWEQETPPTARKSASIWIVLLGRVRQHAENHAGPYGPRDNPEL